MQPANHGRLDDSGVRPFDSRTGISFSAEEVLAKLQNQIDAKRKQLRG